MHRGDADKRWASSVTEMHFYIKPKHELLFHAKKSKPVISRKCSHVPRKAMQLNKQMLCKRQWLSL